MEHAKFRELLGAGEEARIDFKIECHAFASKNTAPRAELAKDICAMANNGNAASYIIIGVSDDGASFRTVKNRNLTDDAVQDFCKKAISPPPKVKVHRERWTRAKAPYNGLQFVIIQVGPQRRQAFRLAQDFIDYDERVCYRRNEVWIRRGATTDLATPEEVSRLASGKPALVDQVDEDRRRERKQFALKSTYERRSAVNDAVRGLLLASGYTRFNEKAWPDTDSEELRRIGPLLFNERVSYFVSNNRWFFEQKSLGTHPVDLFSRSSGHTVMHLLFWSPATSLAAKSLSYLGNCMHWTFAGWRELSAALPDLKKGQVGAVRRVWLLPVLGLLPASRITKAIPSVRRSESYSHYYRPSLSARDPYEVSDSRLFPSSSELLILDQIESVSDLELSLAKMLADLDRDEDPIITPP